MLRPTPRALHLVAASWSFVRRCIKLSHIVRWIYRHMVLHLVAAPWSFSLEIGLTISEIFSGSDRYLYLERWVYRPMALYTVAVS